MVTKFILLFLTLFFEIQQWGKKTVVTERWSGRIELMHPISLGPTRIVVDTKLNMRQHYALVAREANARGSTSRSVASWSVLWWDKRQWGKTEKMENPFKQKRNLFHCENIQVTEQVSQRSCGFFIPGNTQNPTAWDCGWWSAHLLYSELGEMGWWCPEVPPASVLLWSCDSW